MKAAPDQGKGVRKHHAEHPLRRPSVDLDLNFAKDGFSSHKFLIVAVAILSRYCVVGALWFSLIERHSFLNAFYFTIVTLTTIGYGDFYPVQPAGQIFACLYILVGLTLVGWLLGVLAGAFFAKVREAAESAD
jgi:hypothetical protein